jgi:dTDP-glucose pyrophosphorylase
MQPAEAEAEESFVVTRVEDPERCGVARLTTLHECAVAIEIDVVREVFQFFFAERH